MTASPIAANQKSGCVFEEAMVNLRHYHSIFLCSLFNWYSMLSLVMYSHAHLFWWKWYFSGLSLLVLTSDHMHNFLGSILPNHLDT